jgi:hypothetical protein
MEFNNKEVADIWSAVKKYNLSNQDYTDLYNIVDRLLETGFVIRRADAEEYIWSGQTLVKKSDMKRVLNNITYFDQGKKKIGIATRGDGAYEMGNYGENPFKIITKDDLIQNPEYMILLLGAFSGPHWSLKDNHMVCGLRRMKYEELRTIEDSIYYLEKLAEELNKHNIDAKLKGNVLCIDGIEYMPTVYREDRIGRLEERMLELERAGNMKAVNEIKAAVERLKAEKREEGHAHPAIEIKQG